MGDESRLDLSKTAFRSQESKSKPKRESKLPELRLEQALETPKASPTRSAFDPSAELWLTRMPKTKEQYVGKRYGMLAGQFASGRTERKELVIRCICDCGNTAEVLLTRLRRGQATSCGCKRDEIRAQALRNRLTKAETKANIGDTPEIAAGAMAVLSQVAKAHGFEVKVDAPKIEPEKKADDSTFIQRHNMEVDLINYTAPAPSTISDEDIDYDSWLASLKNPNSS